MTLQKASCSYTAHLIGYSPCAQQQPRPPASGGQIPNLLCVYTPYCCSSKSPPPSPYPPSQHLELPFLTSFPLLIFLLVLPSRFLYYVTPSSRRDPPRVSSLVSRSSFFLKARP
ncbi:unnamed protein product [Chondrus crispus]|uniref:Uncharacterized protein n=1 Tax=Chondrus crispus TaxID=2769 RepID=R7QHP0_CHOCR|nr:unnamed protein product [Chondrus crispus]CDF36940.1 unnamed protein product [Chondrus crispus]|eukprot:XP_005716759.1 unnamed protein product [Chondrus crispus]